MSDQLAAGLNLGPEPPEHYSVAIAGAGPVGLALAIMLVQRGMAPRQIGLFDARELAHSEQDPRTLALSYGSRQILEQLGAWPLAATPILNIHVSRRGHFGRTVIDHQEMEVPALGYVCRYGLLVRELAKIATGLGIETTRPAQVTMREPGIEQGNELVQLEWRQAEVIERGLARIAVQAEGMLYSEQQAKAQTRDYSQTAITAFVQASHPIPHRAFERFTDEGPLALLPQDDGYALVWCARPATAAALLTLPDPDFLAQLGHVFGSRLGRFVSVSPRHSFALGLNAQPGGSGRTVAIGNAAQTLHPVAGQGLNLGLRDAAVLAPLLAQEATPAALEQFHTKRQADRSITIRLTDTLARLFASPAGPLQGLLGVSLGLLDTVHPAKKLLADTMMFGHR